jgi:hypothetical protein
MSRKVAYQRARRARIRAAKAGGGGQAGEAKEQKLTQRLQPGPALDNIFHEGLNELHKTREFPRVCDLRRQLNLPREVFDEEIRRLRDNMSIHMAEAEGRYFTSSELSDSWRDENGYIMGTIYWNNWW